MAKTKKATSAKRNTEVAIIIRNHDAPEQQLDELAALAESLAPKFLAEIGATGKQFEVTVANRCHHK
jgi:hypothetical protein